MSSAEIVCDFERRSNQSCCTYFKMCHICPICMFHDAKLFVIFLDCLREIIIL